MKVVLIICSKFLMRLKILNSNEFEKVIIDNVKNVKTDVFLVDDDNRNWLVTFWKIRITALRADRLTIQFSDYVYYDSTKESIEKERKCARWFLIDFDSEIIITRADLREFLMKCWTTSRIIWLTNFSNWWSKTMKFRNC